MRQGAPKRVGGRLQDQRIDRGSASSLVLRYGQAVLADRAILETAAPHLLRSRPSYRVLGRGQTG